MEMYSDKDYLLKFYSTLYSGILTEMTSSLAITKFN